MMLANDDFGVHAEIAGTAKNLYDATNRRGSFAAVPQDFRVDDRAIELGNVRQALAFGGLILGARENFLAEGSREFLAGDEFDVVLHARIIGHDDTAARDVTKKPDDGRMRAGHDAHDTTFRAARAGKSAEARDFGNDVIAVHSVLDKVARDEEVAVEIGNGDVGNDKTIAILMKDQAAANFVARGGLMLGKFVAGWFRGRLEFGSGWLGAGRFRQQETIVGKFFDQAALFESSEHLEQGAATRLFRPERTGKVVKGYCAVSKMKKTQDVIGA
jgi:hypothetical protein